MNTKLSTDKKFYNTLFSLAIPIILQNFIMSSLNIVDTIMVGNLGAASIAGVGLGNQVFFLFALLMFGITSGGAVFTAQYWGGEDLKNAKRILGLSLIMGLTASVIFSIGAIFFPKNIIGLFSDDSEVILLGSKFLFISGFSYIVTSISLVFAFQLRCIGKVKMPMTVTFIALGLNTLLNYCLIFGNFGLPKMGVEGSALATLISRVVECFLIVFLTYYYKYPLAAKFSEMVDIKIAFVKKFFITALPVILNEFIWATGVTMYAVVYAKMGTEPIAAMQIFNTVERMAFVFFFGVTSACAIMTGNKIGEKDYEAVRRNSSKFLKISIFSGIAVGIFVILFASKIIFLFPFNVSQDVKNITGTVFIVFGFVLWAKVTNMMFVVGLFRGGGDTKFAFVMDAGGVWLIGVPLAFIFGLVLKMPLWMVFMMLSMEEFVKLGLAAYRYRSYKWIKNIT